MSYSTLQLTQDGAVLTLTINRPEVLNARVAEMTSLATITEFHSGLKDFTRTP